MKRCFSLLLLFCFIPLLGFSQLKGDYIWQLGHRSAPIINDNPISIEINFNKDQNLIDTFHRELSLGYFNASISDNEGNLLLYSNGCEIRDGNHHLIEGSEHLSPGIIDLDWCEEEYGGYPIAEGGLILSFSHDSILILFHQRLHIYGPGVNVIVDTLYMTELHKTENSYEVYRKSIPIISDTLSNGRLEAVRSYEDDAWWILQAKRRTNSYYTIRIRAGEIDTIYMQSIGDTVIQQGEAAGQSVFSPDGSRFARFSPVEGIHLFDFDRESGELSNHLKIHAIDSGSTGGIAFSPNSRFIYACGKWDMYQFDTWADDIEGSRIHLGHYDGYLAPFAANFFHMELAPDCRIYGISTNGVRVMHVIHEPDKKGLDCRFEQHGIQLPANNSITLPNFPVFRTGLNPPCDPTISTGLHIPLSRQDLKIFPNPATTELHIEMGALWDKTQSILLSLTDTSGKVRLNRTLPLGKSLYHIGLEELESGVYFIHLQSGGAYYTDKLIKLE